MKKSITLISTLIFCFAFLAFESNAVTAYTTNRTYEITSLVEIEGNDLTNLKKEDFERKVGRKLTFKEKIALKILKKRLKKKSKRKGNRVLNEPKTDGLAIASFVCSLATVIPIIGIVGPFLGIIFGIIALVRINESPQYIKGKAFAIAGIVIGAVMLLLVIIYLFLFLSLFTG